MAKKITPIRIDKPTIAEYKAIVKKTKAKIARVKKNHNRDLSTVIDIPKLETFNTRAEYNEWKAKQKSFTNRSNTEFQFVKNDRGFSRSKKDINQAIRDTKVAQRVADKLINEAKDKPYFSGGEVHGTVGQQMSQKMKPSAAGIVRPPDFDFSNMVDDKQFDKKAKNMSDRSDPFFFDKRMTRMKDNFTDLLSLSLNSWADELVVDLKEIPAEDFYDMYLQFEEFDFDLWDSEGQFIGTDEEMEGTVSQMKDYVARYKKGKINMDLKGF